MRKLWIGLIAGLISLSAFGQGSPVIRGEITPGVYGTFKTDSSGNFYVSGGGGGAPQQTAYTQTSVSTLVTSTSILAANATRKYLQIQNQDAANPIWVNCAGSAAVANGTAVKLLAGQTWAPDVPPSGACAGIATGGTVITSVVEGN